MTILYYVYQSLYVLPLIGVTIFFLYRNHWPQPWKASYPDFDETFRQYVATDNFWGDEEVKRILSQLLSWYRDPDCRGVIVSYGGTKFQMLQLVSDDANVLLKGVPMIPMRKWGHATKKAIATDFLLGSDKTTLTTDKKKRIEEIKCSSEDVFRAIFEHIAATAESTGVKDSATGCLIYRGHLSSKKV